MTFRDASILTGGRSLGKKDTRAPTVNSVRVLVRLGGCNRQHAAISPVLEVPEWLYIVCRSYWLEYTRYYD